MATLQTQYKIYIENNPDSEWTYDEWLAEHSKWLAESVKNINPIISDDFQIGPDGAYEHNDLYYMNNLDKEYQMLLEYILGNGVEKKDRTGTGTKSIFGWQIRHKMSEGFPLLTTKKMAWKQIITELLWFLRGDTNIKYLVDNNCHIWDGDAHKRFILAMSEGEYQEPTEDARKRFIDKIKTDDEFAKQWGELGPVYGRQWRNWDAIFDAGVDQIADLIYGLKTNPDSRRLMVNAWNVGEVSLMVLPPCHYGFQVYTRELSTQERLEWVKVNLPNIDVNGFVSNDEYSHKWVESLSDNIPTRAISLMWNQRSVDTFLGLPFNIASYGLLLEIIAKEVNMVPDELIGNLGDVHLYNNHIEQAELQLTREPFELPKLIINDEFWNHEYQTIDGWIKSMEIGDFTLDGYQSHPTIKAPLSN